MKNNINEELKNLSKENLELKVEEFRQELFRLRISAATTHIKSFPSTQKVLKKNIARVLTVLSHKFEKGINEQ
jgi:ribosomal protein L29